MLVNKLWKRMDKVRGMELSFVLHVLNVKEDERGRGGRVHQMVQGRQICL